MAADAQARRYATVLEPQKLSAGFAATGLRPIYVFGAFGLICTLYGLIGLVRWLLSSPAPIDPGPDPLPEITRFLIIFFQILGPVAAAYVLYRITVGSVRAGRLTTEALIVIAGISCYWQDPMINWYRSIFFYNSHFVDAGNWSTFLPGWINPGGRGLPEPLLGMGLAYIWGLFAVAFFGRWLLGKAKDRWPHITTLQLIAVAVVAMIILDFVVETLLVRTGLWAYPGAIRALSLWGGETYQFPLYESLFWGPVWASMACLYYFRDDRGNTVVERGQDEIKSRTGREFMRAFAVIGFLNLGFFLYNGAMLWTSFYVDAAPAGYPSWLLNGMCGKGTAYECVGPNVPVSLPGSGPVPPFTGNN